MPSLNWNVAGAFKDIHVAADGTIGLLTAQGSERDVHAVREDGIESSIGLAVEANTLSAVGSTFRVMEIVAVEDTPSTSQPYMASSNIYAQDIKFSDSGIVSGPKTFVTNSLPALVGGHQYPYYFEETYAIPDIAYDGNYVFAAGSVQTDSLSHSIIANGYHLNSDLSIKSQIGKDAISLSSKTGYGKIDITATSSGYIGILGNRYTKNYIFDVSVNSEHTVIGNTFFNIGTGIEIYNSEFVDTKMRDFFLYAGSEYGGSIYRFEKTIAGSLGGKFKLVGLPQLEGGQRFDIINIVSAGLSATGESMALAVWSRSGSLEYSLINVAKNTVVLTGQVPDPSGEGAARLLLGASAMPDGRVAVAYRGEVADETRVVVVDVRQAGAAVIGTDTADAYAASTFADRFDGGAGRDTISYLGLSASGLLAVDLAANARNAGAAAGDVLVSIENVTGTALADRLSGSEADNTLAGDAGGDTLIGRGGADRLSGGSGNDTLQGGTGDDFLDGGAGIDLASYAEAKGGVRVDLSRTDAQVIGADLGTDLLVGIENLTGSAYADVLIGNSGNNTLSSGGGHDTMTGGGGNDVYLVDSVGDRVVEAAGGGSDRVFLTSSFALGAGQEVETLQLLAATGTAALNVAGNAFGQTLVGNAGVNVLDGKGGADTLTGGRGADSFVFSTALGAGNVDRITDFTSEDTIRLSKTVFTALAPGELAAGAFVNISMATAGTDARILYRQSTGELFYDADGAGRGVGAVKFAVLDNKAAITHADFVV